MQLSIEPYQSQVKRWPQSGQHILAQFDAEYVVVYQAYCPQIGNFAVQNGYFGDGFKLNRMSWIKTNFTWMMYRSGWGMKQNQEMILAIWIQRRAFDSILAATVPATFTPELYATEADWRADLQRSQVRLQWDPDYDPCQHRQDRRAIQLGLRGEMLRRYAQEWIYRIEDITEFVKQQYPNRLQKYQDKLLTPSEFIYPVTHRSTAIRIGVTSD